MEITWFTAVRDIGISAVLLLGIGLIIWRLILPAVIRQFDSYQLQQQKALEAAQKQQEALQAYYVAEIKSLRDEARQDKQMMFEAFKQNTESNTQLQGTLEQVNSQLSTLTTEIATVKQDMTKVYLILGTDKKLIEKRDEGR
jgi:RNAse (barnase) inhibitor barstar